MKISLRRNEDLTPEITTFYFNKPDGYTYQAGQAAEFRLAHDTPDERGARRWFTLSSSPTEEFLCITTRRGQSSFKQRLFKLSQGDELDIFPAMGDFVLPKRQSASVVFLAAGMGITPVRSIVKWLLDSGDKRDIQIWHIMSDENQTIFLDLFKRYGASYHSLIGRRHAHDILPNIDNTGTKLFYVSGPDAFTESMTSGLTKHGIDPSRIIPDFFSGY